MFFKVSSYKLVKKLFMVYSMLLYILYIVSSLIHIPLLKLSTLSLSKIEFQKFIKDSENEA